jgi:hypothetical protein
MVQEGRFKPLTMDIVVMAILPVVCQKSDFHKDSEFQNSQKLDKIKSKEEIEILIGQL